MPAMGVFTRTATAVAVFLGIFVVCRATVRAEDLFLYLGTIAKLDAKMTQMTVTWTEDSEERSAEVAIGAATSVTREGRGVARSELKVGQKVFVIAEFNQYLSIDVPEATDIMLGRTEWPVNWP
jgi:hypothetical protein